MATTKSPKASVLRIVRDALAWTLFGYVPAEQKRLPPAIMADVAGDGAWRSGGGTDWAPERYAEYYATSVPVYAAVKKWADACVRPPIVVHREIHNAEGKRDSQPVDERHPYQQLLRKVNDFWTWQDLMRATVTYGKLMGSAFWVLERTSPTAIPTAIWVVRPDKIKVIPSPTEYIAGYLFDNHGKREALLPSEVVWFPEFNPLDPFAGLSPLAAARTSIDMGADAIRHNRNQFKNGALWGNVAIKTDTTPSEEEVEDFFTRLKKRYTSPDNSGRPLVLFAGMEAQNLGIAPKDMEYLKSMDWTLADAARAFDVPIFLLQSGFGGAGLSTTEQNQAEKIFWRSVASYLQWMAGKLNEFLSPAFGADLSVQFDLSQIEALHEDATEEANRDRADVQTGILTINEVRAKRGLPAVPWGDAYWASTLLAPIAGGNATLSDAPERGYRRTTILDIEPNGYKIFRTYSLEPANLQRLSDLHVKRLSTLERGFKAMQVSLFDEQRRSILGLLADQDTVRFYHAVNKEGLPGPVFSAEEWLERFIAEGDPLFLRGVVDGAEAQIAEFALGISFDVARPVTQRWLEERAAFWASRVNEETARLIVQEIQAAQLAGESVRDIMGRMEKVFDFNDKVRAEMIARTEMQNAVNQGALEAYQQSGVVSQKRWLTTRDGREREAHAAADGQTVPVDAPFLVGGESIMHPGEGSAENAINCVLPGNSTVAIGILAASRARYIGPALELRTQGGRILTVTPNHPVLTDHGFIAAQLLSPGDHLVCGVLHQGVVGINQNIANVPPAIEQVFGAVDVVVGTRSKRGPAIADFHGDGRCMDGDIEIVATNSQLRCVCNAPGLEPIHDYALCGGDVLHRVLAGRGSTQQLFLGTGHATNLGMRRRTEALALSGGRALHSGEHTSTPVTGVDAVFEQAPPDDVSADSLSMRNGLLGFPGEITVDELADVREFQFSGHVYDLQTISGLYTSSGIFVHNCRCSILPIIDVDASQRMLLAQNRS